MTDHSETHHILYCLSVLDLSPEETVDRIWPNDIEQNRVVRIAWVASRWRVLTAMIEAGEVRRLEERDFQTIPGPWQRPEPCSPLKAGMH